MTRPTKQRDTTKQRACCVCGVMTKGLVSIYGISEKSNHKDFTNTTVGICPACSSNKMNNSDFGLVARKHLKLTNWRR